MLSKAYLNPNLDPSRYYKHLKTYCLLYDQVYVWSPSLVLLEENGFAENDFLDLCLRKDASEPIIVASGRDGWHSQGAKPSDINFRQKLLGISEVTGSGIAPASDYEIGYTRTSELYTSDMNSKLRLLLPDNQEHLDRLEQVAKSQGKPFEWGVLNTYSQDVLACTTLGANSPIMTHLLLDGFKFFLDETQTRESGSQPVLQPEAAVQTNAFESLNIEIDRLSASQIREFRNDYGPGLKKILHDTNYQSLLSKGEDECAEIVGQWLKGDHRTDQQIYNFALAGGIGALALPLVLNNLTTVPLTPIVIAIAKLVLAGTWEARIATWTGLLRHRKSPYRNLLLLRSHSSAAAMREIFGVSMKGD